MFKKDDRVIHHSQAGPVPVRIVKASNRYSSLVYFYISSEETDWDYADNFEAIK